jgi:hypothetical protein
MCAVWAEVNKKKVSFPGLDDLDRRQVLDLFPFMAVSDPQLEHSWTKERPGIG